MSKETNVQSRNFISDLMIGGISAIIAKTIVAPIERVKILFQVQDVFPAKTEISIPAETNTFDKCPGIKECHARIANEAKALDKLPSIAECLVKIMDKGGIAALWRGNFTNIIRYFPTQVAN